MTLSALDLHLERVVDIFNSLTTNGYSSDTISHIKQKYPKVNRILHKKLYDGNREYQLFHIRIYYNNCPAGKHRVNESDVLSMVRNTIDKRTSCKSSQVSMKIGKKYPIMEIAAEYYV